MQGIRAGSLELRDYLGKLDEAQDVQDEKRTGRKTAMELALLKAQGDNSIATQRVANEGGVNVATVNNTGAMDRVITTNKNAVDMQKTLLDAEAPVRTAQAKSLDATAKHSLSSAAALDAEAPFRAKLFGARANLAEAQAENAGFNNTLNKAYGAKRIEAEIKGQEFGIQKMGMEMDLLNRDYDAQNNALGMQQAMNYYNLPPNVQARDFRNSVEQAGQQRELAKIAPVEDMTQDAQDQYADKILGKPTLNERFTRAVPLIGRVESRYRALRARDSVAKPNS